MNVMTLIVPYVIDIMILKLVTEGRMYDTIKLFSRGARLRSSKVKIIEEKYSHKKGKIRIGEYRNLYIVESMHGLSISGSFPKFVYGNNLEELQLSEIGSILEELESYLEMKIMDFTVARLDFGKNIDVDHSVNTYIGYFGELRYFEKVSYKSGLTYRNAQRSYIIYDKIKELEDKNTIIPESIQGKRNIMRLEVQLKHRVNKYLSLKSLQAKDLMDEKIYMKALDLWKGMYFEIHKYDKKVSLMIDNMNDVRQLVGHLASVGIDSLGTMGVYQMIDSARGNIHPKQFSRLKKKIKDIMDLDKIYIDQEDILKELDKQIMSME